MRKLKTGRLVMTKPRNWPTPRTQDGYERRNRKTMERIAKHGGDMTLKTYVLTLWQQIRDEVSGD